MNKPRKRSWSLLLIAAVLLGLFISFHIPTASAAITRIQGNARGYAASGTTVTVTMTNTPTLGSTIIAVVDFYDFAISSFSQTGVTWDASSTVEKDSVAIWKGLVTSAAASKTITVTTSRAINYNANHFGCVVDVCEYAGSLTLDKSATSAANLRNPTYTGQTATTTSTDEVWVGGLVAWVTGADSVQSSPSQGFTMLDGASYKPATVSGSLSFCEKLPGATGQAYTQTSLTGSWWSAGCIGCFKMNPNVNVTFYFNSGGVFQYNAITITNGSVYSLPPGVGVVLSGLANSGYTWMYFSWASNASYTTTNPYSYSTVSADTVWCFFGTGGGSGGGSTINRPFELSSAFAGLLMFFVLFIGIIVIIKRR